MMRPSWLKQLDKLQAAKHILHKSGSCVQDTLSSLRRKLTIGVRVNFRAAPPGTVFPNKRTGSVLSDLPLPQQILPRPEELACNLLPCSLKSFSLMMNSSIKYCHLNSSYCTLLKGKMLVKKERLTDDKTVAERFHAFTAVCYNCFR